MGWSNKFTNKEKEKEEGIRLGCWNKGGALQPLKDKINEIEKLIKTNNFSVFRITEANFFKEDH